MCDDVKIEEVFAELCELANESWSTGDVALLFGARERRVRAVINWLLHRGVVEPAGFEIRLTRSGYPYKMMVYRLTGRDVSGKEKTPDWRGLYGAFGLGVR